MKKVVLSLFAILAGTSFAMAADGGCDAFKWPVAREQALFAAAPAAQSGAALTVGQGLKSAQRQGRVHRQRHEGRPQRIPSEQCHEPRGTGRHHNPVRVVWVLDAQSPQVVIAAPKRSLN